MPRTPHTRTIPPTHLMTAPDGSIYHLRVRPEHLHQHVILVGDPGRVPLVCQHLQNPTPIAQHREFRSAVGHFHGTPITVLSHGIGAGCIDIAINELDALANFNLQTRTPLEKRRVLKLIRIGTSGVISPSIPAASTIITKTAIGLDNLAWFYEQIEPLQDSECARALREHLRLSEHFAHPYAVPTASELLEPLRPIGHVGITLTAPGFFAPQGRALSLTPTIRELTSRAESFQHDNLRVLNIEMEAAPLTALANAMGHQSVTVTLAIDSRNDQTTITDYQKPMHQLIDNVLQRLIP